MRPYLLNLKAILRVKIAVFEAWSTCRIVLSANIRFSRMKSLAQYMFLAICCSQAFSGSPPATVGQPMRIASSVEAAKSAKCIVVATPIKPVAPSTWSFSVEKWLRGSGPSTIQLYGFMAPGFGGTSLDAHAVPGRAIVALLRGCDGPTYSVLGPFVTPDGLWVPTGVYDATGFNYTTLSE